MCRIWSNSGPGNALQALPSAVPATASCTITASRDHPRLAQTDAAALQTAGGARRARTRRMVSQQAQDTAVPAARRPGPRVAAGRPRQASGTMQLARLPRRATVPGYSHARSETFTRRARGRVQAGRGRHSRRPPRRSELDCHGELPTIVANSRRTRRLAQQGARRECGCISGLIHSSGPKVL